MKTWQKITLCISIFVCIHYALSILFHIHFINDWLYFHNKIEFLSAFIVGISGFLNILLFHHD